MKKIMLVCAAMVALTAMTACKGGTVTEITTDSLIDKNDTLWADDHGYWEIKEPFNEEGKTVLYRSCVYAGQEDGSNNEIVLSYYLWTRGTIAYDSTLQKMQSVAANHFIDYLENSGITFRHIQLGDTPRHWYPVRRYQGKYYLYYDVNCGVFLSEGAIIPSCGDFYGYQLEDVEKLSNGGYRFLYIGDSVETATMKLIDADKGLYRLVSSWGMPDLFTTEADLDKYDIIEVDGYPVIAIDGLEFDD